MQTFFMDRFKLIMCRESFETNVLSLTRLKWKRGDIELSTLPSEALPAIRRILQSIESLELYEAYGVMSDECRYIFMKEIIPNIPNLRSLTLDCSILERLNVSFLTKYKENIMKLDEFRIVRGRYRDTERVLVSCSDGTWSFPQNILRVKAKQNEYRE